MISLQKQDPGRFHLRLALVMTLSLLALPYIVDVGYMEDNTPTHSAQEILSDNDATPESETFLVTIYVLDNLVVIDSADLHASSSPPAVFLERPVAPFEYLNIASLISRPPPSA